MRPSPDAGVEYLPELVETGDFSFRSGYEATRRILSRKLRPTAIIAQNDDMAVGAMSAARELGFDVPGDLSVVGFDWIRKFRCVVSAADHGAPAGGRDGAHGG